MKPKFNKKKRQEKKYFKKMEKKNTKVITFKYPSLEI